MFVHGYIWNTLHKYTSDEKLKNRQCFLLLVIKKSRIFMLRFSTGTLHLHVISEIVTYFRMITNYLAWNKNQAVWDLCNLSVLPSFCMAVSHGYIPYIYMGYGRQNKCFCDILQQGHAKHKACGLHFEWDHLQHDQVHSFDYQSKDSTTEVPGSCASSSWWWTCERIRSVCSTAWEA